MLKYKQICHGIKLIRWLIKFNLTLFNDAKELNKALVIPIVQKTYFMNCLVSLPLLGHM